MPGPVSDSYDPEFSTSANAQEIIDALNEVYERLTDILGGKEPMYILNLVRSDLKSLHSAKLTEREWRLLRFAVERARDSI